MESLLNGTQGLGCVDVGAGRHPDGIKTGHVDHLLVGGKDLDVGVFVGFARPFQLIVPGTADGDDIGTRHAAGQRVDVTLAHAAETSDGDVESVFLDRAHGGYRGFKDSFFSEKNQLRWNERETCADLRSVPLFIPLWREPLITVLRSPLILAYICIAQSGN